jgi:hypothetical protein
MIEIKCSDFLINEYRGGVIKRHIAILLICRCRDRMVVGLQLPVQSVPITTINVSSNRASLSIKLFNPYFKSNMLVMYMI